MRNKWTMDTVSSLKGKVIIVTGGNSGIGFEAVRAFAKKRATVIMTSRSLERGEKAMQKLREESIADTVQLRQLDLASQSSIQEFSKAFCISYNTLDILLNNAGIMAVPYSRSQDRFENQIGTNHLGHFYLTGLLIDCILNTPHARIVNVSSLAYSFATIDFDNFLFDDGMGYTPYKSYSRSKLCNLLFTYELQKRLENKGYSAIALSAHPGFSDTNIAKNIDKKVSFFFKLFKLIFKSLHLVQNQEMGALPLLRASVDTQAVGGEFYGPGWALVGYPKVMKAKEKAYDAITASKLWKISQQLTNINYL